MFLYGRGAGIGGLTTAIALSKNDDIHIDVYEAGAELKATGAGIGIGARPWKVLQELGLEEALIKLNGGGGPRGAQDTSLPRFLY